MELNIEHNTTGKKINFDYTMNPQTTPHTSSLRVNYGSLFWNA